MWADGVKRMLTVVSVANGQPDKREALLRLSDQTQN